jgi:hypothetical protein
MDLMLANRCAGSSRPARSVHRPRCRADDFPTGRFWELLLCALCNVKCSGQEVLQGCKVAAFDFGATFPDGHNLRVGWRVNGIVVVKTLAPHLAVNVSVVLMFGLGTPWAALTP